MMTETTYAEGTRLLFTRWGAKEWPSYDRSDYGHLWAISLGLGALFNEDAEAERKWMNTKHPSLDYTPLHAVLNGEVRRVSDVVLKERGIY